MKKSKGIIIAVVIVVIIIALGGWSVSNYNSMVTAETNVQKYASDVQADLQRRADLIPNLVATVKGYAAHEEEIFTSLADARAKMMGAGNMQQAAEADVAMTSALSRLMMVVENYPDLKANQSFLDLQTQLEGTENRIKVARTKYNEAAQSYNTMIRRFPTKIFAGIFGFDQKEFFQAADGAENAPSVNF